MRRLVVFLVAVIASFVDAATINKADWDKQVPIYPQGSDSLYYTIEFDKDSFNTVKCVPAFGGNDSIPANNTSINSGWWYTDTTTDPVKMHVYVGSKYPRIKLYIGNPTYTYPNFGAIECRRANYMGFLPEYSEFDVQYLKTGETVAWDTLAYGYSGTRQFAPLPTHDSVTGFMAITAERGPQGDTMQFVDITVSSDTFATWDTTYNIVDSHYVADATFGYHKNDTFYIDVYLADARGGDGAGWRSGPRVRARMKDWSHEWAFDTLDPNPFHSWFSVPHKEIQMSSGRFYIPLYKGGPIHKIIGLYSDDSGSTWITSDTIQREYSLNEWTLTEIKDADGNYTGDVYAILRPEDESPYFNISYSTDYGTTWSSPVVDSQLSAIFPPNGDTIKTDRGAITAVPPYLSRTSDGKSLVLLTGLEEWLSLQISHNEGQTWEQSSHPLATWAIAKYYLSVFNYGGDLNKAMIMSNAGPTGVYPTLHTKTFTYPPPFWNIYYNNTYVAKTDSFYLNGLCFAVSRSFEKSEFPKYVQLDFTTEQFNDIGVAQYNPSSGAGVEDSTFIGIDRRAGGATTYFVAVVRSDDVELWVDTIATNNTWDAAATHRLKFNCTKDSISMYLDNEILKTHYSTDGAGIPDRKYVLYATGHSGALVIKGARIFNYESPLNNERVPAWCRCGGYNE